ncbi:MAG: hypothetical protein RLZZ618_791 [Pseudomonadota bacterium]
MRLGVEQSLVDGQLASRLKLAFARDTGLAVVLVPGPSVSVLQALERGEIDAALTNAPVLEAQLEKQGLAHDRRPVAVSDLLLVGPLEGKGKKAVDPAGVAGSADIGAALLLLAHKRVRVIGAPEGSGASQSEMLLWRAAGVTPAAPWYTKAGPKEDPLALAAAQNAYTLVERSEWGRGGRKPLSVLVQGDPRMLMPVHVMRSFRVNHPSAKLFVKWIAGPAGQRVAGGVSGWRAAPR